MNNSETVTESENEFCAQVETRNGIPFPAVKSTGNGTRLEFQVDPYIHILMLSSDNVDLHNLE